MGNHGGEEKRLPANFANGSEEGKREVGEGID